MTTRHRKLSREEISAAFGREGASPVPPILSPKQLANLLTISVKTVYEWKSLGRLDEALCKRGKHVFFWRDRVIDTLFNGPEWQ